MGRGYRGKAMVVSVDKATAVRMYDKVQKHWKKHLAYLLAELETCDAARRPEVEDKVRYVQETDMAVVVSQSQNEVEDIQKKGADITLHRKRMLAQDLDEKFKDAADPFRIVFVCAMWMTGFDVQSCSTIYLDKPMRNHTLMQTIARANRVFGEKNNGLIVDYIGVFRNLQQALAIYGSASGGGVQEGELPVMDKGALVESLRQAIAGARAYCAELGAPLDELQAASGFQRVKLLDDAVEAILLNDESRRKYLLLAGDVDRLYKAILPDRAANEFAAVHAALAVIADKILSELPEADISDVMGEVEGLLDKSVAAQPYVIRDKGEPYDLSKIDFDQLRAHFAEGHKRTEAEKLRGAIHARLLQMVRLNKSRMDYLDEYQRMIDEYNAGARNVESFFNDLLAFVDKLNAEERRHIAEQLSEEELAVLDLLTRPEVKLTQKETQQVKKVARDLLTTLKAEKLVLDWRKKQQARAMVKLTIGEMLERLPPLYTRELYQQKCEAVYQHMYDSYYGEGRSAYPLAV